MDEVLTRTGAGYKKAGLQGRPAGNLRWVL